MLISKKNYTIVMIIFRKVKVRLKLIPFLIKTNLSLDISTYRINNVKK